MSHWFLRAELMILGFISLLLTFGQSYIARICIPVELADKMLPCALRNTKEKSTETDTEEQHRRLMVDMILANINPRRILATAESTGKCSEVGL